MPPTGCSCNWIIKAFCSISCQTASPGTQGPQTPPPSWALSTYHSLPKSMWNEIGSEAFHLPPSSTNTKASLWRHNQRECRCDRLNSILGSSPRTIAQRYKYSNTFSAPAGLITAWLSYQGETENACLLNWYAKLFDVHCAVRILSLLHDKYWAIRKCCIKFAAFKLLHESKEKNVAEGRQVLFFSLSKYNTNG